MVRTKFFKLCIVFAAIGAVFTHVLAWGDARTGGGNFFVNVITALGGITVGTAPAASAGQVSAQSYSSSAASGVGAYKLVTEGARYCLDVACTSYIRNDGSGNQQIVGANGGASYLSIYPVLDEQQTSGIKTDAIQTHTGGATAMNINTTGTGGLLIGNATSGQMVISGGAASYPGSFQVNGGVTMGAAQSCVAIVTGGASKGAYNISGANCGIDVEPNGAGVLNLGNVGTGTTNLGNSTGGVAAAGPVTGVGVTGSWDAMTLSAMATTTPYGGFELQGTVSGAKFGGVTCTTLTTAGAGTAGTLVIRNVTDATNLCAGSFTCTTAKDVAQFITDCNTAPVAGKIYAVMLSVGCGTTNPTGQICTVEIRH